MRQVDVDFYSSTNASDFVDNLADNGYSQVRAMIQTQEKQQ